MTRKLGLRFLGCAIVYFLAACVMGLAMLSGIISRRPDYIVAHAHLALLGWVSATIMGVMYQQVPTLTSADLYSQRLGEASFWLLNVGVIGFSLSFVYFGYYKWTLLFALAILLAAYIFAFDIFATLKNRRAWTFALNFYALSVAYFAIACTVGVLIVLARMDLVDLWSLLPRGARLITAHAHLALLGWVSVIIIGAMSWMFPMVVMKELYRPNLMNYVFWLLGLGVVGFFVGLLTRGFGIISLASAIVVTISVLLFAYIMLRTVTGKLKVDTRVISTETKFFEAALIYLVLVTFIGVTMLLNPGLVKGIFFAHAHLALLGWVSITIFGGMYHVIPMLAWAGMMEKKVQPLPTTFKELYSERLSRVIFWLSNIGLVGLLAGSFLSPRLATISGTLFTIAAFIFSYEMLNIIRKG